jgi:hypothetical protein
MEDTVHARWADGRRTILFCVNSIRRASKIVSHWTVHSYVGANILLTLPSNDCLNLFNRKIVDAAGCLQSSQHAALTS